MGEGGGEEGWCRESKALCRLSSELKLSSDNDSNLRAYLMHENIRATVERRYETVSLGNVKPLALAFTAPRGLLLAGSSCDEERSKTL